MWDHSAHSQIFFFFGGGRKSHQGSPNGTKMGLNFFLSQIQCGLLDAYPAPILTTFETTDVSWCPGVYTHEKFPNFCVGVLQDPKTATGSSILVGCWLPAYSSNGKILGDRNYSGASRHPKMCHLYVSFDGNVCYAMYATTSKIKGINTTPFSLISEVEKYCVKLHGG